MKIIDLLNKIANGEEVPKKIKYDKNIYILNKYENYENVDMPGSYINWDYVIFNCLNEEIEIIEEDKKIENNKINKIIVDEEENLTYVSGNLDDNAVIDAIERIEEKINEIIDFINKGE